MYIANNLMSQEKLVHQTRLHWVHFISLQGLLTLFLLPLIEQYTNEFAITNYRIVMKTGWLRIWSLEMNLAQVEAVLVDQSILGGLLGFGNIVVIGSGGTREYIANISNPLLFRKRFLEAQNGISQ